MKDYARSFYKSKAWKETQAAYMSSKHYICERCGDMAKVVHHREYITPENINDPNITLSWSNLEALCQDCHTREHLSAEVCAEGLSFNSKGELIYTPRQEKRQRQPRDRRGDLSKPLQGFSIMGGVEQQEIRR